MSIGQTLLGLRLVPIGKTLGLYLSLKEMHCLGLNFCLESIGLNIILESIGKTLYLYLSVQVNIGQIYMCVSKHPPEKLMF